MARTIMVELHTLSRAKERGTTKEEICDVIRTGEQSEAKNNRLSRRKVFPFGQERNGKFYEEKMVEVIYTIDDNTIFTVTAYVFYGKWRKE